MSVEKLIVDHMETWTSALQTRSTAGRGSAAAASSTRRSASEGAQKGCFINFLQKPAAARPAMAQAGEQGYSFFKKGR